MAACVAMETGDDRYEDQHAVASCIVNRVKSKKWGKTISDVIYADGQFPGASSGLLDKYLAKGPSKSCIKATKDALAGSNNIGDIFTSNPPNAPQQAATLPTRSLAGTVSTKNNILSAGPAIGISFQMHCSKKTGKAYLLRRCFPCFRTYTPFPLIAHQLKTFFLEINTTLLHFCY